MVDHELNDSQDLTEMEAETPKQRKQKHSEQNHTTPAIHRFGMAARKRNECPLCNYVKNEVEKGRGIPIEEWIYLNHLQAAHKLEA